MATAIQASPTDAQLRASAVPVSGPATDGQLRATPLPVSGTVNVGNFPATQPVSAASLPLPTGASTEATLALIKAKTDNLDVLLSTRTKPADAQKVDGSAVTQPVSGTVAISGTVPVSGPLTDTQLRATPVPVSGTVTATGPLTDTQLRASAVPTTASDPLTKGTQGATGFSVQPLRDAGRVIKTYSATGIAGVTAIALATLVPQADGTAGAGATSFAVTAGKRLRITAFIVSFRTGAAAANWSRFSLLMSASGAVTTGSAIVCVVELAPPAAVLGVSSGPIAIPIPDGLELSGTQQFGVAHIALATTNVESITVMGYEY